MDDNNFDEKKFNDEFEQNIEHNKKLQEKLKKQRLNELNGLHGDKRLYEYSISETFINMKDCVFDILDDILCLNVDTKLFTKNNRLYYIGILLIIVLILIQLCENIVI